MVKTARYTPGVCNIGPAERRKRRIGAIVATGVTFLLLSLFVIIDAPLWLRFVLVIPATGAAIGFLQDALHFCAAFGIQGIYNVLNSKADTTNVDMQEFRQKDAQKARSIVILSGVIGICFTALTLLVPSLGN